ncbi:helix-turn-helix domain-containing protein [Dysgonomonas sp. 511]|uniref:helix-turn-helix domain-containing protein n=1 Tax=Dysgonomonas sp. 511 TaxID=2302930 RepID=UPI0013D5E748|nr:XRE family transcriptional regulator [Dysgonomonas sp. 511]NDV78234.1 XRE family transcriptional regulator [Dysgonomonas sp. 511]
MEGEVKEIGLRLKGLREALELSPEQFAASCNIPIEEYLQYEAGEKDLTISTLKGIATKYNVDVSVLMFADEPRMSSYFLTRKGKGLAVNRVEAYSYQTLAGGFNNRKAEIFEVTVEPKSDDVAMHFSSHAGQEFNTVLEGRMLLDINGKELVMEQGDSIYFDSSLPHGMKALDGKKVKLLVVVL